MMSIGLLRVRSFSLPTDRSPVISDLNYSIDEGAFLAILGPNGSGKTVLVKSLLGLLPHRGEANWY